MYPDFQYVLQGIFKTDMPSIFSYNKTFGFFVAIAFLLAAWVLTKELKRKEDAGLLMPEELPASKAKKWLPQGGGQLPTGTIVKVYPHQRVGEIVFLALVAGLIGAKVFNALETWETFIKDPVTSLISGSGLTFYGGLIVATVVIYFYCRKHKINVAHFCDAIAPTLMLAYGVGRLGCHFSGDGDWGIFNSAYVSLSDGSIKQANIHEFNQAAANASSYFATNFGSLSQIPATPIIAPSGMPTWLYAMNFSHNVNNEGIPITGCVGQYCHMLPVPVFPTSFYEAVICLLLFGLLWAVRKKFKYALHLFGLYLILNGFERFFIEKMKVNYKYEWGFIHPAQSEIISVVLVLIGVLILIAYKKTLVMSGNKNSSNVYKLNTREQKKDQ